MPGPSDEKNKHVSLVMFTVVGQLMTSLHFAGILTLVVLYPKYAHPETHRQALATWYDYHVQPQLGRKDAATPLA